jgi:flagellar hook-associated protein FlgK
MKITFLALALFAASPALAQTTTDVAEEANDLITAVRNQREDAQDRLARAGATIDKLNRLLKQIDAEQDEEQDAADK